MTVRLGTKTLKKKAALLDDTRWAAVESRNKKFDGSFYYSVATTGVYCRPSCPSRMAKRIHVFFHETVAAAEAKGFRPCKRCKPVELPLHAIHAVKVSNACRFIESAEELPSLAELAQLVQMSPYHFHRTFKASVGLTPKAYAVAHRHKRVRDALGKGQSVTAAINESGYNSSGRFYATSSEVLGMTPSVYRSGGANITIRYAVGHCSLGAILVAASDRGVCAVLLGDNADALTRDLKKRFPKSQLIGGDKKFEELAGRVISYVEDPETKMELPLDILGTAFQHRVWQALRDIPAGSTVSYADLAEKIGKPKAVRAVASACGANPIAVIVPCHRVVRNDGALSGYRWGLARKAALLKRENRS